MSKGKLIIVITVLVLILTLGIFEQIFIKKTFEDFSSRLESFIVEEDETYDYGAIVETKKWWDGRVKYLELFLPHVQLNEITITCGELVGAVGAEDHDSAQALLNRIQSTAESFETMYAVRLGNII